MSSSTTPNTVGVTTTYTTTTTTSQLPSDSTDPKKNKTPPSLNSQFATLALVFAGAIIVVIFTMMFRFNKSMFVTMICLYLIGYSLFIVFMTNKKKDCYSNLHEYNAITYITLFTLFFAIFIFIISIYVWKITPNQPVL
jgi:hypothetical protein